MASCAMEQQTCCYLSRGEQGEVCQDGVDGDEELTYLVFDERMCELLDRVSGEQELLQ